MSDENYETLPPNVLAELQQLSIFGDDLSTLMRVWEDIKKSHIL
jgi:hypothetical protein